MEKELFEKFNNGELRLPGNAKAFKDITWSKHPTFEGVELKHIITAKETGGTFSYHLVRIAPNKSKNRTHRTAIDWIEIARINIAKKLLKDPAISIADISSLVGLPDQSYFSRFFKKKTGQTPSEFRNEL